MNRAAGRAHKAPLAARPIVRGGVVSGALENNWSECGQSACADHNDATIGHQVNCRGILIRVRPPCASDGGDGDAEERSDLGAETCVHCRKQGRLTINDQIIVING
jgi:hypothetical protein